MITIRQALRLSLETLGPGNSPRLLYRVYPDGTKN